MQKYTPDRSAGKRVTSTGRKKDGIQIDTDKAKAEEKAAVGADKAQIDQNRADSGTNFKPDSAAAEEALTPNTIDRIIE